VPGSHFIVHDARLTVTSTSPAMASRGDSAGSGGRHRRATLIVAARNRSNLGTPFPGIWRDQAPLKNSRYCGCVGGVGGRQLRQLPVGALKPASAAIPTATAEKQHDDNDDQKSCGVHSVLRKSQSAAPTPAEFCIELLNMAPISTLPRHARRLARPRVISVETVRLRRCGDSRPPNFSHASLQFSICAKAMRGCVICQ
jgi:hypothetical protein